ncbi:uncharacterized protein E0L32_000902 [Thyridium curvatum]|uniref:Uncharacterized protein n=1 Tax=Thyridium curvatum TaxID=1093900 RepID=A0A507APA3_9PEZI|nr:uncharacterized protein E0L32_000902 [Thyridium curvatum]TPX12725.1 hypothetical protein E0L32_000902 [Thyridium curvatum]
MSDAHTSESQSLDVESGRVRINVPVDEKPAPPSKFWSRNASSGNEDGEISSSIRQRRMLVNVISREARKFDFDEEEIFKITQNYKKYEYANLKLKDLRKFDDCEPYGLADEAHESLLKKEIHKLCLVAASQEPYLFSSGGHFKGVGAEDYQDVANVLDQVYSNNAILRHDTEQIALEKTAGMSMSVAIEDFKQTRTLLLSRYDVDEDFIEGSQPVLLEPPSRNKEAYHTMVDYLLGSIARVWVRSASGSYWDNHMLAVLAAWAVKLKVIAYDPHRAAVTSLANGEDILDQVVEGGATKKPMLIKVRIGEGRDAHEKEYSALNERDDIVSRYYREKILIRRSLEPLLQFVINAMFDRYKFRASGPIESFEMCALVYKTGLDGVTTTINHDRYGDIHTSCEPAHINNMYSAMVLLMQNLEAIRQMQSTETRVVDTNTEPPAVGATLNWNWRDKSGSTKTSEGRFQFHRIDDIITIAIAVCMSTVYMADSIGRAVPVLGSGTTEEAPIMQFTPPPRAFQAVFHLSTEEYLRRQRTLSQTLTQNPEVRSLASSPLRHGIRAGTNLMLHRNSDLSADTRARTRDILDDYAKQKMKMDTWIIDETSISIKCRAYVLSVIIGAATLVCGAMAIPFTVGEEIRGVDPFQITSFSWILAGFLVILAKSRYVSEWPWHDFLRGQIVCTSIQDVQDVSGVDPQIILMYLLHGERQHILKTRGPFNGMFFNRESQGLPFSIDVPVQLSTMLASGFLILKVINEEGEHLISVDVRKGSRARAVRTGVPGEYMAHLHLDEDIVESDDDENDDGGDETKKANARSRRKQEGQPLLLFTEDIVWTKTVGFFIRDVKFG